MPLSLDFLKPASVVRTSSRTAAGIRFQNLVAIAVTTVGQLASSLRCRYRGVSAAPHALLWLCLAGMLLARPLHAAPPAGVDPNSEIGRWFQSLLNSKGEICCSVADCRRPYAWRQTMGRGYQVQEGNGAPWLDVPSENILSRKNPIGDAIACIVGGRVRCFIPPSET